MKLLLLAGSICLAGSVQESPLRTLHRSIDLNLGESQTVELCDGKRVTVKLLNLEETRDELCSAVIRARVKAVVGGIEVGMTVGSYALPVSVGDVRIDCTITKGYYTNCHRDFWGLVKDARLRLWPAGSPLLEPGTFVYPLKQRWFAGDTWMANEPVLLNVPKDKIYYHSGLDLGGSEGMVEVVSATDGVVVAAGQDTLPGYEEIGRWLVNAGALAGSETYILDGRGWYHWYAHLKILKVRAGQKVKMGQKIGLLGKEGSSGGWSHLHYEIKSRQPSGRWGTENGYPFIWEAYVRQYGPPLIAVVGPLHHELVPVGGSVTLEASRSRSFSGEIVRVEWGCSDETTASGPSLKRTYLRPGTYSEVLRVTDSLGNVDYDFALVEVVDPKGSGELPPRLNATYAPTTGLQPGDPVTFKVRTWNTKDGGELWDFGDGSPRVATKSEDSYAETVHSYEKPGHYLVRIERTGPTGAKGTTHLQVRIGIR